MKCESIGVIVKSIRVKNKIYEEILTEVAEIVYGTFGLLEKSVSTVVGTGVNMAPKNLSLSQSDKKGCLR